jgi:hypothetical protein
MLKGDCSLLHRGLLLERSHRYADWIFNYIDSLPFLALLGLKLQMSICCSLSIHPHTHISFFLFCSYELRAIQKEKVRRMATESSRSKEAITVEVELQETKGSGVPQTSEVNVGSQVS